MQGIHRLLECRSQVRACGKRIPKAVMCIHCATHRRSVFLGMPLGTLLKPCAWQSTCEPEQLHLCGHARAATRHSKPHSRANKEPRWRAGRFSRAAGAIVPAAEAIGKLETLGRRGRGGMFSEYPVLVPKSITIASTQKKKENKTNKQ